MYHPGKVVKIYSKRNKDIKGDTTVQATVEMWDENLFTFLVDKGIVNELKEGDIVLVDYRNAMANLHSIIKILRGNTANDIWARYKKELGKNRTHAVQQAHGNKPFEGEYFG